MSCIPKMFLFNNDLLCYDMQLLNILLLKAHSLRIPCYKKLVELNMCLTSHGISFSNYHL